MAGLQGCPGGGGRDGARAHERTQRVADALAAFIELPVTDHSHRIAVGVEAVRALDRLRISGHGTLVSAERGDQHQQRGPRQMKVRKQAVHDFERVGPTDEQIRRPAARHHGAIRRDDRLERAHRGSAHGPPPPAGGTRRIDARCGGVRNPVGLVVHIVQRRIVRVDGSKRAKAHVQCKRSPADALGLKLIK